MKPQLYPLILSLKSKCLSNEARIQKDLGLSHAEFNALISLEKGGSVSGRDLAEHMGLSPSRTSRVVFKLQQRNLIKVKVTEGNRRSNTISLSAGGLSMKRKIAGKMEECEVRIMENIPKKRHALVHESLQTLVKAL